MDCFERAGSCVAGLLFLWYYVGHAVQLVCLRGWSVL
jgi:hypothetical protein